MVQWLYIYALYVIYYTTTEAMILIAFMWACECMLSKFLDGESLADVTGRNVTRFETKMTEIQIGNK